jgi:hypothetical protein
MGKERTGFAVSEKIVHPFFLGSLRGQADLIDLLGDYPLLRNRR